jgi:hypothetical protein
VTNCIYSLRGDPEPRFRLYSSSIASSQNDAGSSGSFSSVQSSTGYRKHLHLVPFSGYQIGGEFEDELTETDLEISDAATAGFLVNYDYSKSSQIEFYYSHQETELSSGGLTVDDDLFDLDVDYFHIGGTMKFGEDKWVPYVVGTLGLTRFEPDESQADSLTRFSLGFGGGFRYMPIQRLGIYLGARAFVTFIDSDYVYVSEGGESTLLISSDTLWQFQFMAGVVFVF